MIQNLAVIGIVALAAIYVGHRFLGKGRHKGCGCGSSCPGSNKPPCCGLENSGSCTCGNGREPDTDNKS